MLPATSHGGESCARETIDLADDADGQLMVMQEDNASEQDNQSKTVSYALPDDFCPNPYTVIIGKGKMIRENLGNKRLRVLASNFLTRYSESNDKRTKTAVVNELIGSIQSAGGSFVRKDKDGRWYQASDQAVREKIGYVFRDLLSDRYRSSSKSKAAKRHKEQLGRASIKLERAMRLTHSGDSGIPTSILFFDTSSTFQLKNEQNEEVVAYNTQATRKFRSDSENFG